jgi:hypothetical protein
MKSLLAFGCLSLGVFVACISGNGSASPPATNPNAKASATVSAAESNQQSPADCALTISAAPAVKGLRLRMTAEEMLALFPGSKDDQEVKASLAKVSPVGTSSVLIQPSKYLPKKEADGVTQIAVNLLDGRISNFTVSYNGPAYSHVDQFVAKVAEVTGFPPAEQWQPFEGMDTQSKVLKCTDFEVRVFAGGEGGNLNYVLMQDLEADKEVKERRRKAREKARPTP